MMSETTVRVQARPNNLESFSMANSDTIMEQKFARNKRNPEFVSNLMANCTSLGDDADTILQSVYDRAKH